ncbi:MAG: alpha/beta fold hydrolase [Actinomycetota bacterium]
MVTEVEFGSAGLVCRGWHMSAVHDGLVGPAGRPVVVIAHGVGGTVDTGLRQFAENLCAAGVDALAFDYRGFGTSEGEPRQSVSMRGQIEDLNAAVEAARLLPGVDGSRVVLWGVSLAGGHVLSVAGQRGDVAGVIAVTPLVDGWAAAVLALRYGTLSSMVRCTLAGVRSRNSVARGGDPVNIPIVGPPGQDGAINLGDAYARYTSLAGPTWRNEIDARIGFELLRYRPVRVAASIRCPVLIQIGDRDRSAPPHSAAAAAAKCGAEVRRYDADHFDVWPGGTCFDGVLADQRTFLASVFAT